MTSSSWQDSLVESPLLTLGESYEEQCLWYRSMGFRSEPRELVLVPFGGGAVSAPLALLGVCSGIEPFSSLFLL